MTRKPLTFVNLPGAASGIIRRGRFIEKGRHMAVMMIVMVAMLVIGGHHGFGGGDPPPPAPEKVDEREAPDSRH